jgi:glycosyltransferase involved in cell wall biosynthesis
MKVLLIDVVYAQGSTGKIVQDLEGELVKNGHEVQVAFGRGNKPANKKNIVKVASKWEVYFHVLMTRITGLTGFFSPLATWRLIRQIKRFAPDVVHIHELHGYYVNIVPVIKYLKKIDVKVVWTFHCEFMYTGKCGYAYECEGWKKQCGNCPHLNDYPRSLYLDFTRFMFNQKKTLFDSFNRVKIVTPSKWLADRVSQSFLKTKDIRVIHNGINTESVFFPRDSAALSVKHHLNGKKVVLAVAPDIMEERKGGEWVVRLAESFSDEFVFILVGVKDTTRQFPSNVIALARTDNQHQLAEYYSLADLFLITSMKETFSLVVAESLACGTPVIGFDSVAPKEVALNT